MISSARAEAYLTISAAYGGNLGGLVWTPDGDAIERWNGTTLAFAAEIRSVLEGVFAHPPVPPFDFVLFLLRALRDGPDTASVPLDRLWRAHTAAKGSAGLLRNSGLLLGELCRGLPAAAVAPAWPDLAVAVGRGRAFGTHWGVREEPALSSTEFQRRIEARIEEVDDEWLLHWLKHGCGPAAGAKLAEPVESLPQRIAKVLALARRLPRLAGAATLVPTLDGALALPPRRRSPHTLPQGGYCDVTTRGEPERLLPGQFALDRDEFVRRFAERELLYFQREEPHAAPKPDRVIVIDQGVRTWGSVRLALAAAALVLMKADLRRVGRVRLAATSIHRPIDVMHADLDTLVRLLEASDLTPNCARSLNGVLADSAAEAPRDVVLLTHPRTLLEPQVIQAVKEQREADRLFALTVDDRGRAELHDWAPSGPRSVRTFRVDLLAAEATSVEGAPVVDGHRMWAGRWTGDVEPIGFPFRPGLLGRPTQLTFDAEGDLLVVAGSDGVLHGLARDGSPPEVLPRPYRNGSVLKQIEALLGVPGGVVVCGRMTVDEGTSILCPAATSISTTIVTPGAPVIVSSASTDAAPPPTTNASRFVAAHYDLQTRKVAFHILGPAADGVRWSAHADLNCIVVAGAAVGCALDLATGGRAPGPPSMHLTSRAAAAWIRARGSAPTSLPIHTRWSSAESVPSAAHLFLDGNVIDLRGTDRGYAPFEPQRDGKPLLAGTTIHNASLAGNMLALRIRRSGERSLLVIDISQGRILGDLPLPSIHAPSVLSSDGHSVAFVRPHRTLVIADTADLGTPRAEARPAGLHDTLHVRVHSPPFRLCVRIGGFQHEFSLLDRRLTHRLDQHPVSGTEQQTLGNVSHSPTAYDRGRFPAHEAHSWAWRVVPDRFGQVLLYRHDDTLIASFLVRRERAAAWLPGDVFWGDPVLIGGPATPNADLKFGAALREESSP